MSFPYRLLNVTAARCQEAQLPIQPLNYVGRHAACICLAEHRRSASILTLRAPAGQGAWVPPPPTREGCTISSSIIPGAHRIGGPSVPEEQALDWGGGGAHSQPSWAGFQLVFGCSRVGIAKKIFYGSTTLLPVLAKGIQLLPLPVGRSLQAPQPPAPARGGKKEARNSYHTAPPAACPLPTPQSSTPTGHAMCRQLSSEGGPGRRASPVSWVPTAITAHA